MFKHNYITHYNKYIFNLEILLSLNLQMTKVQLYKLKQTDNKMFNLKYILFFYSNQEPSDQNGKVAVFVSF
jgi:hypothetical protein